MKHGILVDSLRTPPLLEGDLRERPIELYGGAVHQNLRTRVTLPHLPYKVGYLGAIADVAASAVRTASVSVHEIHSLLSSGYVCNSHSRAFARESANDRLSNTAAATRYDSDPSDVPRVHVITPKELS